MNNPVLVLFLLLSLSLGNFVNAQVQKQGTAKPDVMTKKDSLLCQDWKLISTEQFGVSANPTDKQKADMASFGLDHKAKMVTDGVDKNGSWSVDKGKTYLTFTTEGNAEKHMLKIIRLAPDTLILEYKDPALVKTHYTYTKGQ